MSRFLLRRFMYFLVTIWLATVVVFAMSRMSGDPRLLYLTEYSHLNQENWDAWGRAMGLDKPLPVQYLIWLGKFVQGDWGKSIVSNRPVADAVLERLPATLSLAGAAFVFSVLFGIPLGVLSAVKKGTFWDYFARVFAMAGQSFPAFWLGIIAILVLSVQLGWLPTSGTGGVKNYIMPSVTMGWVAAAGFLRLTRSAMLDVLGSEYMKLARIKGVGRFQLIWKHAFRNALTSPLTFAGLILADFAGGSVVIETVFAWPGIGLLAINAVFNNDFPVLVATVLLLALLYLVTALAVDILYAYIDPRVRYQQT